MKIVNIKEKLKVAKENAIYIMAILQKTGVERKKITIIVKLNIIVSEIVHSQNVLEAAIQKIKNVV
jgi:hypothetical protein